MQVKMISYPTDPYLPMWLACKTCSTFHSVTALLETYKKLINADTDEYNQLWAYLKRVLDSGHLSIAEHLNFTFHIEGVSRSLTHQLVRHRHATFSQQSQRVTASDCVKSFVMPTGLDKETQLEINQLCFTTLDKYKALNQKGVAWEDARAVLPNAHPTKILMTCNLRELMLICSLRLCSKAQREIRELFTEIKSIVTNWDSNIGSLLVPKCEDLGYCNEKDTCNNRPTKTFVFSSMRNWVERGYDGL